jgi:glutathione peroxidase
MKLILPIVVVIVIAVGAAVALKVNRVMGKDIVKEPAPAQPAPARTPADKADAGRQDAPAPAGAAAPTTAPATPLDFVMKDIDGKQYDLAQLKGKVVMFVNVASRCGFTPQYEGLEKLYETYKDKGFVIVGFPANNFGAQEPGTNEQIKQFCSSKYSVTFPMMSKISVKGGDEHPLYRFLTEGDSAGDFKGEIGWNFTKFLIDKSGHVFARFASKTKPLDDSVTAAIDKALAAEASH